MRRAATVLVAAPIQNAPSQEGLFRLLYVKRHSKARFMPSAYVFPGGVLETSDQDPRWRKRLTTSNTRAEINDDEQFKIGALRELFEEANILLASSNNNPVNSDSEAIREWRDQVLKDPTKFLDMCESLDLSLQTHSLFDWARWITPEAEKYRYDTSFFFTALDNERAESALHCEKETVAMEWLSPEEALRGFQKKEKWLPPPTWINTWELSKLKLEEVEEQKRDLSPIMPIMKKNDTGFLLLLPEDHEHGEGDQETKVEHRALVNTKEREIEYRRDGKVIHATQLFSD